MNDHVHAARLRIASASVTGTGGREMNEDAHGARTCNGISCHAVADGAGGHAGGAVAARTVVDMLLQAFGERPDFGSQALSSYVARAASEVARLKATQPLLATMHSTLALLLVDATGMRACWAHIGDTRVYLFRDGHVRHVTRDHSLAQQFIDAGLAKDTDPRAHAQRSVLYAAIGAEGQPAASIQAPLDLLPGDALLVCTDGLWELVKEETMEDCLAQSASVDAWLAALCKAADSAAGPARDNFTAQALWIAA